jgi:putative DNA primase/helicase
MIDIPAVRGAHGIFDDIHKFPTAQKFADNLKRTARENYGWALQDFLTQLTDGPAAIGERFKQLVSKIMRELMQDHQGVSSEISRVAESFAVVAAAGEIATQMGITGWVDGHATWGAKTCFAAWLAARAGTSQGTDEALSLSLVRLLIEQHGDSRFDGLSLEDRFPARDRLGYRWYEAVDPGAKEVQQRCIYLFTPEAFKQECSARGFQVENVVKTLKHHGWLQLIGRTRGNLSQKGIRGQRISGYAVQLPEEPEEAKPGDQGKLWAA